MEVGGMDRSVIFLGGARSRGSQCRNEPKGGGVGGKKNERKAAWRGARTPKTVTNKR